MLHKLFINMNVEQPIGCTNIFAVIECQAEYVCLYVIHICVIWARYASHAEEWCEIVCGVHCGRLSTPTHFCVHIHILIFLYATYTCASKSRLSAQWSGHGALVRCCCCSGFSVYSATIITTKYEYYLKR